MDKELLFEEKQYLGYNKYSIVRRMIIAIFCFLAFFYSDKIPNIKEGNPADLLFLVGIYILIISVVLVFILHIKTKVIPGSLILEGLWTARKIKIDLNSIVSVKKTDYSKYVMNRPVYNLHRKGKIKFYTNGIEAVELIDRDGLIYIIGSQKPGELESVLNNQIPKK